MKRGEVGMGGWEMGGLADRRVGVGARDGDDDELYRFLS